MLRLTRNGAEVFLRVGVGLPWQPIHYCSTFRYLNNIFSFEVDFLFVVSPFKLVLNINIKVPCIVYNAYFVTMSLVF